MNDSMIINVTLAIVFLPLAVSVVAFFFGKPMGKEGTHTITIAGVGISFLLSCFIAKWMLWNGVTPVDKVIYHWATGGDVFQYQFDIGFLIDPLTAVMLMVVTFVSLLVHIYSIGYMNKDPGYQRFFSYISFFTFSMLMLITANNFLQLFFGWEAVGLASYLLIGFWYHRESANQGSLKAFLVNRVGDFGFLIGIALILGFTGSLSYEVVFDQGENLTKLLVPFMGGYQCSVIDLVCVLLFVGAMGKSAQVPLHVWLPESMEGPTPISALIHAATMVTAGVFMVSRMSPLYEYSEFTLNLILVIGSTGALFLGLIGVVMNDIKRIVAYSTLSQLGYMMVGAGSSAYAAAVFHLGTHACFKALLFLGAGSVIMAMHHEQDIQKMGGLRKVMPITYWTVLIGSIALCGLPPFSGFFSKDIIIEAVHESHLWAAPYAYACVVAGTFVTALYTFRSFFLVFHTYPRMDKETKSHLHESPRVVTFPLVALAIPSVLMGFLLIEPWLFASPNLLTDSIFVMSKHDVLSHIGSNFEGPLQMIAHSFYTLPFILSVLGVFTAFVCYEWKPEISDALKIILKPIHVLLLNKYGFDCFNEWVFIKGGRRLGQLFYKVSDMFIIDGLFVNGSANNVGRLSRYFRLMQTGSLNHYAFSMIAGLLILIAYLLFNPQV